VDNWAASGCEQNGPTGNHTQDTAYDLGSHRCFDDEGGSFSGSILSDARAHENPAVTGFAPGVGAAPTWWRAYASGGTCTNDTEINLTMSGGTSGCYRLTYITNNGQWSATVMNGSARIALGSGSYSDDTNVYFVVEKVCGINVRERADYVVGYHL